MKHQFKPFDQVLVRDSNSRLWRANFYSHRDDIGNHVCISGVWNYCIPYNEETAHLLGTTNPYTPPQSKEWEIRSNNGMYVAKFTSSELKHFIETAVINNKDITNFTVTRIF